MAILYPQPCKVVDRPKTAQQMIAIQIAQSARPSPNGHIHPGHVGHAGSIHRTLEDEGAVDRVVWASTVGVDVAPNPCDSKESVDVRQSTRAINILSARVPLYLRGVKHVGGGDGLPQKRAPNLAHIPRPAWGNVLHNINGRGVQFPI